MGFSLSALSSSTAKLLEAGSLVIHFLRFSDLELAKLGATRGADRFGEGLDWERLPTGEPRYCTVGTWFRAKIVGSLSLEGATMVAAQLLEGAHTPCPDPSEDAGLVYAERAWHRLPAALSA